MKKKKIAVFGNGWNSENLYRCLSGMQEAFEPDSADIFLFLSYASYGLDFTIRRCESTAYDIPDLSDFDGAVIFGPGLNFPEIIDHIFKLVDDAGIPTVSIGIEHPGCFYIAADNYTGMKALCDHLIDEHGVKDVLFVAGSAENFDSNERIRALSDAMGERGLSFKEDSIFYSDWEAQKAYDYILDRYSHEKLPDAIICANDLLALAISVNLDKLGVTSPEDVILTGFDYLEDGKFFYPSIATVDQRYDLVGKSATRHLYNLMNGTATETSEIIPCEFMPGESCGCFDCRNDNELRHKLVRALPVEKEIKDQSDVRLTYMERAMNTSRNFSEMKTNLRDLFYNTQEEEGGTFYIILDSDLARLADDDFVPPDFKYGNDMTVVVGKKDGVPVKTENFKRSVLIPDYEEEGRNMIYCFCVIYYRTYCCGYVVMSQDCFTPKDHTEHRYKSRIMRAMGSFELNLELVKLNDKLATLMEQDTLTKVKNRTAFEKYTEMIDRDISDRISPSFAVIYLDINDLKKINDELGHEKGDEYIRNCCSFICQNFKHSPVFRIGGDEFVTVAIGEDYMNYRLLVTSIKDSMKKKEKEKIPTKRISIAIGYSEYDPSSDKDFAQILKRADDMMYKVKAEMKKGREIR